MPKWTLLGTTLLALLCVSCAGAAQPARTKIDQTKYLTADKVRRGMKGYGLTVFQGVKPEKFDVEVLGVMHNVWGLDSDIILIRCTGHNLEHTGIAGGMSGSPVYVDGRLIGALAYGFSYARAAIAGVTPIAEMLPLLDKARRPKVGSVPRSHKLDSPIDVLGERVTRVQFVNRPRKIQPDGTSVIEMCPIATPVRLSGLGPPGVARRLLKTFGPQLEELGLTPVQGGSAGAPELKGARLVPGAVVGVRLLWGDLDWDAIGTVTEVAGKRVLGFGHPMYADEDVDIPMTTGYVYTVMPSFARTFKLGAGGRIVGRIDTDRNTGVAGTLGATGKSVKLAVSVSGLSRKGPRTYRFEALRHPAITPRVAGAAVSSCLFQDGDPPEKLTVRYTITVVPDGHPPIVLENIQSGWDGWDAMRRIYADVRGTVVALSGNEFERVFPKSVTVDARFERVRRFAAIETVALDRSSVRRGETLRATVELKPPHGPRTRQVVTLPVPPDAPLGFATLQVCGSTACEAADRKEAPGRFDPKNMHQLLALLRKQYRRDRLYVRVIYPGEGVTIDGKELPDLPRSVYAVMAAGRDTSLNRAATTKVTAVPCESVVTGSHVLRVRIEEQK